DCCSAICFFEQGGCACNDANVCTDDGTCNGTGTCQVVGFNANPCQDGNACTTADTCAAGVCVGGPSLDCDDGNPCTDDSCDSGSGCVHTPNTAPCDDGNACTAGDVCGGGRCMGQPRHCDDGNVCTNDSCDPATGDCVMTPNTAACDDGNACTIGSCDPATGCVHAPNTAPCDDGSACTTNDTCSGGTCVGGPPLICPTGVPVAVVEADTYVSSSSPGTNFGTSTLAAADAGPTVQRAFFRVRVSGVGTRQVTGARVRLQVAKVTNAQSVSGGRIHPITDCGWNERTMTWQTQPAIDGPVLATAGAVAQGQAVDFDVTGAIHGDGVYCFALDTPSTDSALYNSREATVGKPQVAVTAVCPCGPGPTTTTTTAPPTPTTTTTLPAAAAIGTVVADTYVQSDLPTTNFGTKPQIFVDNGVASNPGTTGVQHTFLRVSVSGVGARHVTGAHLK